MCRDGCDCALSAATGVNDYAREHRTVRAQADIHAPRGSVRAGTPESRSAFAQECTAGHVRLRLDRRGKTCVFIRESADVCARFRVYLVCLTACIARKSAL